MPRRVMPTGGRADASDASAGNSERVWKRFAGHNENCWPSPLGTTHKCHTSQPFGPPVLLGHGSGEPEKIKAAMTDRFGRPDQQPPMSGCRGTAVDGAWPHQRASLVFSARNTNRNFARGRRRTALTHLYHFFCIYCNDIRKIGGNGRKILESNL